MSQQQEIFEQNLRERFKNRWRKTNYWFALPNRKDVEIIDAAELYPSDNHFPSRWIRQLLDSDIANAVLKPTPNIETELGRLHTEQRKNTYKKFGFGYPMLIMKDTTGQRPFISAPLFVWQVDLVISEKEEWELSKRQDYAVSPNELVIQYLANEGLDLRANFESAIEQGTMNTVHLQKICNEIAVYFDFESSVNTLSLKPFPIYNDLNKISEGNGQIIWSGVLGLFEALPNQFLKKINQVYPIINADDSTVIEEENAVSTPENVILNSKKHYFSGINLDPYQSNILRETAHHQRIAVKATNYTGLNQLVLGLVTNSLSNSSKTLIVSEHSDVLQRIQDVVNTHYGTGHLAVKLDDFYTQKEIFYNVLREIAEGAKRHVPIEEEEYQVALNIGKRLQAKLDEMHDALNEPLFKGKKWIELIGDFLKTHQSEGRQFLNSQLLATDYTYTDNDYEELKSIVLKGKRLYKEVNTLRHPLEVLHEDIFINNELSPAKDFTTDQIEIHSKNITELYHEFVLKIEEYGQALQSLYETHYNELSENAEQISNAIIDNQQRFGANFNNNTAWTNFKLKFLGLFSKRSRNISEVKQETFEAYQKLSQTYYNKRYFDYSFSDIKGRVTFDKINEHLTDLKASLRNWKQDFPVIIHNEIQRLSEQTVHPDLDYKTAITDLNKQLATAVNALNTVNLFQQPYENKENFVINNKVFLEKIMDQTESLNFNLRDFDAYFAWKKFWLGLTVENQKLLKAFITTKPENWEKALDSWFLHQVLTKHESEAIPNSDSTLQQYFDNHEVLQNHINLKTRNYWTHRRGAALRDLKRDDKIGFNAYFTKKTGNESALPFERMFQHYQKTIQGLIPVFCTTPTIAQNYFNKNDFDNVIILEADSMTVETGYPLLNIGNQAIIIGNGKLKRLGKSDTLMEYALTNFPKYELLFQTNDKQLFSDFVNRAFHKQALQKGIAINQEQFYLDLNYVEGSFDEEKLTNETEANEIISILKGLYPENNRYLPKVGIVCFTKAQRDLLSEKLLSYRKHKVEGHQAIAHFLRNGLTICALEDIVGKQFDITIIGTTFSRNSNIEADFSFLSGEHGEYLMYNLLTASRQALLVCSSLTHDFIEENKFTYTNNGLHLLSNLMDFIHCNKTDNVDRLAAILAGLYATFNEQHYPEKNMITELRSRLQPSFTTDRIQDSIYDLAKIDFWISAAHENQLNRAIVLDSYFWRFPKGDYIWDKHLRAIIAAANFDFQAVWSVNWWKYPEKTPTQFVETIVNQDIKAAPIPVVIEEPEVIEEDITAVIETEDINSTVTVGEITENEAIEEITKTEVESANTEVELPTDIDVDTDIDTDTEKIQ